MTSIARKNLLEDIPRFLVAQVGILFAVSLVTIQTGLQSGFTRSTSLLISQSRADLWVADKGVAHLGLTAPIPYSTLNQIKSQVGVRRAEAILIRPAVWRLTAKSAITPVTLIGADPGGILFNPDRVTQGSFNNLKTALHLIADEAGLKNTQINTVGEINGIKSTVIGFTRGTQSVVFENVVFASLESTSHYVNPPPILSGQLVKPQVVGGDRGEDFNGKWIQPMYPLVPETKVSFVLVQLEKGVDPAIVKDLISKTLPDLAVLSRAEMAALTESYWQERSGIGFILGMGAVVGIVVGAVVVGQILYASVSDHLKEFGTLKAMGASDRFLYVIILEQALWMSVLGYLPGMALCLGIASWTSATQSITILITLPSAIVILGVTFLMCIGSAVFAIQKVVRVDPSIVFKS